MATEAWLVLGVGVLLAVAIVAHELALMRAGAPSARWAWLALIARGAATAALLAAWALIVYADGGWLPDAPGQVALGLALASLLAELALRLSPARRRAADAGLDFAGLFVALLALALGLLAIFWMSAGGAALDCTQRGLPFLAQWSLLLAGSGAAVVASASALALALAALLARLGWERPLPRRLQLHGVLKDSTALALLTLGGGLGVRAWWTWRATGQLAGSDSRLGWLATAWLLTAMSRTAWRLGWYPVRLAAGLTLAAALAVVAGLFAL